MRRTLFAICFAGMVSFSPVCSLQAQETEGFRLPVIPTELRTPAERAAYLTAHYWEHFDFADSLQYLNHPETVEQAAVDFIDLFRLVPDSVAGDALAHTMEQAASTRNGLFFFYNTFEKYLYDLASPMRNEVLFIPVLEYMATSGRLSADDKIRPQMLLQSVRKNQVGTPAADFTFTLSDGSRDSLYALPERWTVLLFFDPSCDECHQALQALQNSPRVREWVKEGQLTVLAVYPGDDLSLWRQMQPNLPADWIIAYDGEQAIYEKELYDILGFPAIYLLDGTKQVRLKETSPQAIEEFLAPVMAH